LKIIEQQPFLILNKEARRTFVIIYCRVLTRSSDVQKQQGKTTSHSKATWGKNQAIHLTAA
jgi:hypothetical protein